MRTLPAYHRLKYVQDCSNMTKKKCASFSVLVFLIEIWMTRTAATQWYMKFLATSPRSPTFPLGGKHPTTDTHILNKHQTYIYVVAKNSAKNHADKEMVHSDTLIRRCQNRWNLTPLRWPHLLENPSSQLGRFLFYQKDHHNSDWIPKIFRSSNVMIL